MEKIKFNWVTINKINGYYWIPTFHTWITKWDTGTFQNKLNKSYGFTIKFICFEYGIYINKYD